jgi:DNA-binding response OmpR family regulator
VKHRFRILVIEDNSEVLDMVQMMLEREGFEVVIAEDALIGLREAYRTHPDIVLLDVMMPGMDGFEALNRIRELTDVPVIIMTGHATGADDVVRGFTTGADDYITKPFNRSELISRIYARLRGGAGGDTSKNAYVSPDASVVLNVDRHEITIEGRHVYLPPKEFKVLQLLLRQPGQVVPVDAILTHVWGAERVGEPDLVKQYIYRIRKRIEAGTDSKRYIHSVRGGGYYFEIPRVKDPEDTDPAKDSEVQR